MARKRLTPPQDSFLSPALPAGPAPTGPFSAAPIARIAGETTAVAALREVTDEMAQAREAGRLVQMLPVDAVEVDHLIRDRLVADPEEMAALKASLAARGQQQPIDVVDLGGGRYGLISGWRRLSALQSLHEETGESRFSQVQALLRRPDSAAGAYLSMVEENEIRAGLSHYERARIAALAADQGVFASAGEALRALYPHASRAKRSKIGSFITLHRALGPVLRFPAAIPERLGLALAQAVEADPAFAPALQARLQSARPATPQMEQALLSQALRRSNSANTEPVSTPAIQISTRRNAKGLTLTLQGPGVTEGLRDDLQAWLTARV